VKTFVTSVPKSGTYLLRQILEIAGLGNHQLHISELGTYDYSKVSMATGRRSPTSCLVRMSLSSSLAAIPEGGFAVGHLECSEANRQALDGLRVIFITRNNLKDTVLSYMVHQIETGRALRATNKVWRDIEDPQEQFLAYVRLHGERIINIARGIMPWKNHAGLCLHYETLSDELTSLRQFLGSDVSEDVLARAFDVDTLTKSSDRNRDRYWSDEAHRIIDALLGKRE